MQQLKEQIAHNLIAYQKSVDGKLRELNSQGLLSDNDKQELMANIEAIVKAVLNAFDSQKDYPESAVKIYVENLFEKYRSEVEAKIAAIEKKRLVERRQKDENVSCTVNGEKITSFFSSLFAKQTKKRQVHNPQENHKVREDNNA
jgi:NurA-like 5'-3' nuclease